MMNRGAAPLAGSAMALLAFGLALTACNAVQQESSLAALPQQSKPVRAATASPSPIPFAFQTVDDPSSTTNEVTAIDGAGEIVGTIGNGKAGNPYQGYSSTPPYSSFTPITYDGADGIVITGLSVTTSRTVFVGYVIVPPSLRGTWGYENINGIANLTKDPKGAKGKGILTEILGVNDSETAVGTYNEVSGVNAPFVLDIVTNKYSTLKPPGNAKGAAATGIDDDGDIVGWVGEPKSASGFFERLGTYTSIAYSGATTTQALGVNVSEQIVGDYADSKGTHGFILTGPTGGASGQVWQTIDEPNAAGTTVVTGINANDDICGYYVDSSDVQHGFVAVPNP
jgi:hypothetical protein